MIIYKICNTKNNKIYIGKTIYTAEKRFKKHITNTKHNNRTSHLYNAIRKHGSDVFEVDTICCVLDKQHMNDLEILFITGYNSTDLTIGYNMTPGGEGGGSTEAALKGWKTRIANGWTISEDHKQALVDGRRRIVCPTPSHETRKKISNTLSNKWKDDSSFRDKMTQGNKQRARRGDNHHMFGKTHTVDARKKISEARQGKSYDEIYGPEQAAKIKLSISIKNGGKNNYLYKSMDAIELIEILIVNPRITTKELAKHFGMSKNTASKRIREILKIDNLQKLRYKTTDDELIDFYKGAINGNIPSNH